MLLSFLIAAIIVLGLIVYYIYYLAPRLNPLNKIDNFLAQNMIDDAILEYKKILEDDPSNYIVNYKLGKLYFKQDNIDLGIQHFEKVHEINKYNFEVDKVEVLRMLARAYHSSGDYEEAFQYYYDIVSMHPNDKEALYHVSFILLGQEAFDLASTHFDRLVKNAEKSFELFFGAGIASLQCQKIAESINYFNEALSFDKYSEITNLAISFALLKKREFKKIINFIKVILENTADENASFISKRLLGFTYVQANKVNNGMKIFEELLESAINNELEEEKIFIFYDLGMSLTLAGKTEKAYEYLNEIYEIDRDYKNIQRLITLLRKDMDDDSQKKIEFTFESVDEYVIEWQKEAFPDDFIWRICGLKSNYEIDMNNIQVKSKIRLGKDKEHKGVDGAGSGVTSDVFDKFYSIDLENFRIISNRVISKLGYNVDEILNTYKDSDGVDFIAHSVSDQGKALIWVRRWKDTNVGEIPLRNFAQAINDFKVKEGLFIATSDLNSAAERALKRLSKVKVISPDQLTKLLSGLL